MKKSFKILCLAVSTGLLTSCTSSDANQGSELRQGELQLIQGKLRELAMERWESNLPKYFSGDYLSKTEEENQTKQKPNYDAATVAWRESIGEQWKEIQGQKNLDLMCQLWFEGWLGLGDSFADMFAEHRAKTDAMGIKIETLEDVKMAADNRKTINYPKAGEQARLFTCEAITVFRMARPGLTKPAKSSISFVLKLVNNEIKASFTVQAGLSTEEVKNS
jgi:hypothetical protein